MTGGFSQAIVMAAIFIGCWCGVTSARAAEPRTTRPPNSSFSRRRPRLRRRRLLRRSRRSRRRTSTARGGGRASRRSTPRASVCTPTCAGADDRPLRRARVGLPRCCTRRPTSGSARAKSRSPSCSRRAATRRRASANGTSATCRSFCRRTTASTSSSAFPTPTTTAPSDRIRNNPPIPLYRGDEIIEQPVNLVQLDDRFVDESHEVHRRAQGQAVLPLPGVYRRAHAVVSSPTGSRASHNSAPTATPCRRWIGRSAR